MSKPANLEIYNKVKDKINANHKPSAYTSALIVREYKNEMEKKGLKPYIGRKKADEGLKLWFDSKWTTQRGDIGYKYKSDIYRPNIKVNSKVPLTFNELTPQEINKARVEKRTKGRVNRFRKT